MEKRKKCFILTMIGCISIIVTQTIISLNNDSQNNKVRYIKENLTELAKKCVREKNCTEENITIESLEKNGYIDRYFMLEISQYSKKTFVKYPNYDVELIESSREN